MWYLDPSILMNVDEVDAFKILNDRELGKELIDPVSNPSGEYWIIAIFKSGNKVEVCSLGMAPPIHDQNEFTQFMRDCYNQLKELARLLRDANCIDIDDGLLVDLDNIPTLT